MHVIAPMKRHPGRTALLAVVVVGLGSFSLWWFAPWNLIVDRRVDEAVPGATAPDVEATPTPTAATGASEVAAEAAEPVSLAGGEFASLEHATTGAALLLELDDGRRFLRLEGLETSNGPDLRVILSDQPVSDDWHVWDDGRYVDLGALKGNVGSSNYPIPADLDLARFETAVIWCRRFSVGFGVAPLEPSAN